MFLCFFLALHFLKRYCFALQASADYGYGYSNSPRAYHEPQHDAGRQQRGGDYGGAWAAAPSHHDYG